MPPQSPSASAIPPALRKLIPLCVLLDSTSIVYFSLSSAFVAHAYGSLVLMLYTGACFFVTAFGYWTGLIRLRAATRQGGSLIRLGARGMALALAASAFLYPWGLALPVLVAGAAKAWGWPGRSASGWSSMRARTTTETAT